MNRLPSLATLACFFVFLPFAAFGQASRPSSTPQKSAYRPIAASAVRPRTASTPSDASASLPPGPVSGFKLLNATTVWVSKGTRLFMTTTNGAQWQEITPPNPAQDTLTSIFFLDANTGWVLLSHALGDGEAYQGSDNTFSVVFTTDGGTTWTTAQVADAGGVDLGSLGSNGNLAFSDSRHGWLNLDTASSVAFNFGITFSTDDGGKTWTYVDGNPGISGEVVPVTPMDGWIAGGPANTNLFATHDGGATFQEINLPAPPSAAPAQYPTYAAPMFADAQNGYIAVTYSGDPGTNLAAVLFATTDGGRTWTADRTLKIAEDGSLGNKVPTTVVGDRWILPNMPPGSQPAVISIVPGVTADPKAGFPAFTNNYLAFLTPQHGCIDDDHGAMYCTDDGGVQWTLFAPGSSPGTVNKQPAGQPRAVKTTHASRVNAAGPSDSPGSLPNSISQHLGFDTIVVPSTYQMQAWWASSPYYDAAFYVNGGASHVHDSRLTSGWVNSVTAQGWALMPIWSGLQAPCACRPGRKYTSCTPFPHTFSADPTTAFGQGQSEADKAFDSMTSLGLKGNIVYVDLESYSSATCGSAVSKFVAGWAQELQSLGGMSGVYTTAINASMQPLPIH